MSTKRLENSKTDETSTAQGVEVKPMVMPLEELTIRAEKVMELKKLMDKIFNGNCDSHLGIVIMAAIADAYRDGQLVKRHNGKAHARREQ
jgi:hypothetical protein